MINSPSDRVPEKASRWDLVGEETCDGEKSIPSGSLMSREYLRIYRGGIRSRGATRGPQASPQGVPPKLVAPSWFVRSCPETSRVSFGPERINPIFFFIWTLFDIDFPKKPKTRRKKTAAGTGH